MARRRKTGRQVRPRDQVVRRESAETLAQGIERANQRVRIQFPQLAVDARRRRLAARRALEQRRGILERLARREIMRRNRMLGTIHTDRFPGRPTSLGLVPRPREADLRQVCAQRKTRRELMFATRKTGAGARARRRRTWRSEVRC